MDEKELLSRARSKIAKLPPKQRVLGVVRDDGAVDVVVRERSAARTAAASILQFRPRDDSGLAGPQGDV